MERITYQCTDMLIEIGYFSFQPFYVTMLFQFRAFVSVGNFVCIFFARVREVLKMRSISGTKG